MLDPLLASRVYGLVHRLHPNEMKKSFVAAEHVARIIVNLYFEDFTQFIIVFQKHLHRRNHDKYKYMMQSSAGIPTSTRGNSF